MKLTGITKKRIDEFGIELSEMGYKNLNNEHSRNNTTTSNEGIFYKDYGYMRDIVFGNLFKFNVNKNEITQYALFLNGKKIDFIDNAYALEKLVETSDNTVLIRMDKDKVFTPWLLEKDD